MTEVLTADLEGQLRDSALSEYEADARQAASDAVAAALDEASPVLRARASEPGFPTECFIPNKRELGKGAGERIVYRADGGGVAVQELSRAFDRLGDEIDQRIAASR